MGAFFWYKNHENPKYRKSHTWGGSISNKKFINIDKGNAQRVKIKWITSVVVFFESNALLLFLSSVAQVAKDDNEIYWTSSYIFP